MAQPFESQTRGRWSARLGACSAMALVGAVGVWTLQGRDSESSGRLKGRPEEVVGLVTAQAAPVAEAGEKSAVLSICGATQISLNLGKGVMKYDLSSGPGSVERECPFGSRNLNGKMRFECQLSGMWKLTTHNCYQCQGFDSTLTIDGHDTDISLPFGEMGEMHDMDCKFKGHTFPYGKTSFSCGSDRKWSLVEASCSDSQCAAGKINVIHEGKHETLTVESHSSDAKVQCPAGGEMTFKCVKSEEQEGDVTSYHWQAESNTCENEFPHVKGWCPGRTATLDMKQNWDTKHESKGMIKLAPSPFGMYEYPCPSNSLKPDGKVLFECKDFKWAMKVMDCMGEDLTS